MYGYVLEIPEGDAGTVATIEHMRRLALKASSDPLLVAVAYATLGRGSTATLRGWLGRVHYLDDPADGELVRDPVILARRVLAVGFAYGDCDDVATLAAAVGLAGGYRVRFVVVGFGDHFEHVWTEIEEGGRWREMDTTRPAIVPGTLQVTRELIAEV